MSALLRDIFNIPEHTDDSDYVLKLVESVDADHLANTLSSYVVTPDLARAFDQALSLVADAIRDNTSRGAFLAGSFGSGKSHFMAVLYALLRQDPRARALAGLAEPIARHDAALQQRRILPLTLHMLDAKSMEQAIFDGYLRQIGQLHPDAVPPVLHQTGRLLEAADALRSKMGDDSFFAALSDSDSADASGGGDVWGAVLGDATSWTAEKYAAARAAAPDDANRAELVSALTTHLLPTFSGATDYLSLDEGLTTISTHAASLGYDAVVLFLDELVLWLAFQVRNVDFFGRETQKLSKLVEGGWAGRKIPFVSFVARQVDLRRWLADSGATGQEQAALQQGFEFQSGRFPAIKLGDDNLPYVANRRLLTPRDDQAQAEIDRAFDALDRRDQAWRVLLDGINTDDQHHGSDAEQFRLTYPFSPALVSTLRSLAAVMQRERTALKVMQQLLVNQRDHLTIDDVVPVGDAFDLLITGASGQQPLDEASAALFRAAGALYQDKLRPIILQANSITEDDLAAGAVPTPALESDLRLAKTLLLSAVAPNVPALKGLTASRLAALNHGSIRTPLPGGETSVVLAKVRNWNRYVPEIKVEADSTNPLISVHLSDVDYESVVEKARIEDNEGRRRELIKRLVAEGLGIELGQQDTLGAYTHQLIWRGSRREVDLLFGNVRDAGWLSDEHFRARPGTCRFIIDHPFDDPGHSPREDQQRVEDMKTSNWDENTIVWLPRFFTEERQREISRLVILNYLLEGSGERFTQYADHLSEAGRLQARTILQNQRDALLHTINRALQVAYEVESPNRDDDVLVERDHQVLLALTPRFSPQPPAGGTLRQAFERLASDAFDAIYPEHPRFEPAAEEIRGRELKIAYDYVERALADPEHRIPLGPEANIVRRVVNPLGVGRAAETHYLLGDDYFSWGPRFERKLGARGDDPGQLTVGEVRGWLEDAAAPVGLLPPVADLVILAWAALRRRAWFAYNSAIPTPEPGQLKDAMELREQPMPELAEWQSATQLAGALFGITAPGYLTPTAVAKLADDVKAAATQLSEPATRLVAALEGAYRKAQIDQVPANGRLATAQATAELMAALRPLKGLAVVTRLAAADFENPRWAGRSLATAQQVADLLTNHPWDRYQPLHTAALDEGSRADQAAEILHRMRTGLLADELPDAIEPVLKAAEDGAFRWLQMGLAPTTEPTATRSTRGTAASGRVRLRPGQGVHEALSDLQRFVDHHSDATIVVEWRTE